MLTKPPHQLVSRTARLIGGSLLCASTGLAQTSRERARAQELFHLAAEALRQGEILEAEAWLRSAVEHDPSAITPRLEWTIVLIRLDLYGAAESALAPLAERIARGEVLDSARTAVFYRLRAALEAARDDHTAALESYELAVSSAPDDIRLRLQIVGLYRARDRIDETVPHLRAIAAMRPGSFEVQIELAQVLLQLERWVEAEFAFDEAAVLSPENATVWDGLGRALAGQHRCLDAERAFRAGIDIDPGSALIHEHLGDLLFACRRFDAALGAYEQASELSREGGHHLEAKIDRARRSRSR